MLTKSVCILSFFHGVMKHRITLSMSIIGTLTLAMSCCRRCAADDTAMFDYGASLHRYIQFESVLTCYALTQSESTWGRKTYEFRNMIKLLI